MATYLRDVANNAAGGLSIPPQTISGNTTGAAVDLGSGTGRCCLIVGVGLINSLTNLSFQVEQSASSGSGYSAISGATITILNTSNPANTTQMITFDRDARYVRTVLTATGATVSANTSALILEQKVQT